MNFCVTCKDAISESEIYCDQCQSKRSENAQTEYVKAMMRDDILSMFKMRDDYPNLEINAVFGTESRGDYSYSYRQCPMCCYKNQGEGPIRTCKKCGSDI